MERVGVVGLGLLGASFAKAIRAASTSIAIVGVDPNGTTRDTAIAHGIVDEAFATVDDARDALSASDLVLLAAPIAAIEALIEPVSKAMRAGSVLTDVGGVKSSVVAIARASCAEGVAFVGAHPMFGGPDGSIDRARDDLWRGGVVFVCDDLGDVGAIDRVASLHASLGARIVRGSADDHDRAAAIVSHAPYLIAHALRALADDDPIAATIAGPGFARVVRSADFAFHVQGEVALRNARLPETIDALIDRLTTLRDAFDSGEVAARRAIDLEK